MDKEQQKARYTLVILGNAIESHALPAGTSHQGPGIVPGQAGKYILTLSMFS